MKLSPREDTDMKASYHRSNATGRLKQRTCSGWKLKLAVYQTELVQFVTNDTGF